MAILVHLADAMVAAGNIKQSELAERSGVDIRTTSKCCNQEAQAISLDNLSKLCAALGTVPGVLLELVEDTDHRLMLPRQVTAERRGRR